MNDNNTNHKPTVLLIEDDNFITTFMVDKLTEHYHPVVAATTSAAEAALKEHQIDLIALDILLPEENGFALLERLRSDDSPYKDIPVIILTNFDNQEDIDKAHQLGVTEYLVKSEFTPQEIVKKIDALLKHS